MVDKSLHLKIVNGKVKKASCPSCRQPAEAPHTPFCSRRCAQLDLGNWLAGNYAIPAYEAMDDSELEMLLAAHDDKELARDNEES